jgi:hypothetical protein
MRMLHVVFDFIRCPYAEKIVKGKTVYTKMTGNPNFPSPDVPLSRLKDATDQLESCYLATMGGSRETTARLHQQVKDWIEMMRIQARYVERIAKDDIAILLSSGFNPAKPPIPGPRAELKIKDGEKSGSVFLRKKASKNGYAYLWQICINSLPQNENKWKYVHVSVQASCILYDLKPITRYWFRAAVVTPQGISAFCNPVMHVVT